MGYAELLDAIKDPKYKRHAELTEWIGVDFDPDAVDPEWLTADVASLAKKWSRKPTAKRARRACLNRGLHRTVIHYRNYKPGDQPRNEEISARLSGAHRRSRVTRTPTGFVQFCTQRCVPAFIQRKGNEAARKRLYARLQFALVHWETVLNIRAGYDIAFECFQDTSMVLMLSVHPSRHKDLLTEHRMQLSNGIASHDYRDAFGNICTRLTATPGLLEIRNDFIITDSGLPDEISPDASQWDVAALPDDALVFLLGSRYCDTEKLSDLAWSRFGGIHGGWQRVQAICDYVHNHIEFGYHHARCDRTASEGHTERIGVCRDFAHLAVTLCRCMNIPARYCTGYLGDIGVPRDPAPMDFSAWFEAFLDGRWFTFDARHNHPRIGRIVMARGRDAADVAISTAFGPAQLARFTVVTEEVAADQDCVRELDATA